MALVLAIVNISPSAHNSYFLPQTHQNKTHQNKHLTKKKKRIEINCRTGKQ